MMQIRRLEGREEVHHEGRTFTLVSRSWTVRFGTPWFGLGWVYHRPRLVESGPESAPIQDHVMVARMVAGLLLTLAVLIRRRRS